MGIWGVRHCKNILSLWPKNFPKPQFTIVNLAFGHGQHVYIWVDLSLKVCYICCTNYFLTSQMSKIYPVFQRRLQQLCLTTLTYAPRAVMIERSCILWQLDLNCDRWDNFWRTILSVFWWSWVSYICQLWTLTY